MKFIEYFKLKSLIFLKLILIIAIIISPLFVYLYFIRPFINKIEWNLFCNSNTILITPSLGLWSFLECISPIIIFITFLTFLNYIIENRHKNIKTNKKNKTKRKFLITILICLALLIIPNINYCRIDENKICIRDFRTLFIEKEYTWDDVNFVKINYYKNSGRSGGSYNLQYIINFDSFNVNIADAGLWDNIETLQFGEKEIHSIIKEKGIYIYKNINAYTDEIISFLNMINEN